MLDYNDIWAVGEIFVSDENGEYDLEPYGLVKWNDLESIGKQ